jgi:hypothetical protein
MSGMCWMKLGLQSIGVVMQLGVGIGVGIGVVFLRF